MLRVRYYGSFSEKPIDEYLTIDHPGYAGEKARRTLASIAQSAGLSAALATSNDALEDIAEELTAAKPPRLVTFERDGKFFKVKRREW
jgi:hypothetical protein